MELDVVGIESGDRRLVFVKCVRGGWGKSWLGVGGTTGVSTNGRVTGTWVAASI
jgi:hypothetical protein